MTQAPAPAVLKVEGLRKSFGAVSVIDGIDLEISSSQRHLILGANGAGKTTFFNLLTGQLPASAGRIEFCAEEITWMPARERARRGLGRTFQIASLFPDLTIFDNLRLAATAPTVRKRAGEPAAASIERALEEAGFKARARSLAGQLSYGEQRRLEIALALIGRPRMLLLDEPMAGLTRTERLALSQRIVDLSSSTGILLIEHDLDIALSLAERLTVFDVGRVIADGPVNDVMADSTVRKVYLG